MQTKNRLTLAIAALLGVTMASAAQDRGDSPRLPRPRPDVIPKAGGPAPTEDGEHGEASEPAAAEELPTAPMADEAALAACERELRTLGVDFERRDPIPGDGECGVAAAYNVRQIADGVILQPDTEFTCETALATARWVQSIVMPAAEALGDGVRLKEIAHASTYVCRNRNGLEDTKISEHSRGAALDVASFAFASHGPIPVAPRNGRGTLAEAFQQTVRAGACLYFTTVLGPGTDDHHDDHLHLDLSERSSGYRLCQ